MSLLTALQDAADELGINRPSSIIGNTSKQVRQLFRGLCLTADDLSDKHDWPELVKTQTITLINATSAYAYPPDFKRLISNTEWNRETGFPLYGPMSPQDYAAERSAISSVVAEKHFLARGAGNNRLVIYPTPTAGDAGDVMAFDYVCTVWSLPPDWETATAYAAGAYCSYDGVIYQTTDGGTSGANTPTHTTGTVTDGAVFWETYPGYFNYPKPTTDGDSLLLDENLLRMGTIWQWRKMNHLSFEALKKEYEDAISPATVAKTGAKTLYIGGYRQGYQLPVRAS